MTETQDNTIIQQIVNKHKDITAFKTAIEEYKASGIGISKEYIYNLVNTENHNLTDRQLKNTINYICNLAGYNIVKKYRYSKKWVRFSNGEISKSLVMTNLRFLE